MNTCPRALVVDDEHDTAESFARLLKALGCDSDFVTDPRRVVDVMARMHAQIVFLDIGMPDISGYELADMLRGKYGWHDGLRLVAVTAYGSDEDRARSRAAGFDAHVLKPVSPELVESMLHTLFPGMREGAEAPQTKPWTNSSVGIPVMTGYAFAPKTKLLLAVTPDVLDRFQRILTRHDVTAVSNAGEAMRELEDHYGMVILSVHFAESQMFSLLGDIRSHSKYRKVPILCVLGTHRVLTDIAIEGLDHAVKAMRANGFLDLHHFDDDEEGNARIRRIVDYLILIDGDLQHIARTKGEDEILVERRRKHG
jgi:CheY-like chemotaxis protein